MQFNAASYSVNEGKGTATITITLSAALSQAAMVAYATSDGTAVAGSDYDATAGTVTFLAGETNKTFDVDLTSDALDEPNETILLALSSPSNAILGTPATATLSIQDDDPPPGVQFSVATYSAHEGDGSTPITVTLDAASSQTVSVAYATSDGSATASGDYMAAAGTITFLPGETSKTFNVTLTDDTSVEGDETFALALNALSNANTNTPASATLTIVDDDPPVPSCRNVVFTTSVSTDGTGVTTMVIDLQNNNASPISSLDMQVRVFKNTDEKTPTSGSNDAAITSNPPDQGEAGFINYTYTSPTPGNASQITASYQSTLTPPLTDDDIFRVLFDVGGITCSFSGTFPQTASAGPAQPVTLTITKPGSDGQVIGDLDDAARFTATASSPAGIIWTHFTITHEGSGQVIWDWMEFYDPYCTFGDDSGVCRRPDIDYPTWWSALGNGSYRLDVTTRAADSGTATASRRFQILH